MLNSFTTIRDFWQCELDENNKDQNHICTELRRAVNCKTTIAPPIKAEVLLRINNRIKASAYVFCGWDPAVSEIRFCFIILCFISIYYAFKALSTLSKKTSEIVYINIYYLVLLLRDILRDITCTCLLIYSR